jgi:predicted DNA-binding transcriptional regulator AlpA
MTVTPQQSEYVRSDVITSRIGIHLATLGRWIEAGWFPPPIRLGASGRHRRWRRDVIEQFLRNLEGKPCAETT